MGVLSDYFVAEPEALALIDANGALPAHWPRVDAKGFGVVPLDALAARLGVRATEPGPPTVHGSDFEWFVLPLTSACAQALAGLAPDAIGGHAAELASMEELGWPPTDVERLLQALVALAREAGARRMYLWVCV